MDTKHLGLIVFYLELILALTIPFIIFGTTIPTNVIHSMPLSDVFESIMSIGNTILLIFGIPVGTIGVITPQKTKKRRIATVILSIINILAVLIEIVVSIAIICAMVFGGDSV